MILFDLTKLKGIISECEKEQDQPGFWDDQRAALAVVNKLKDAKNTVESYEEITSSFKDLESLLEDPDAASLDMRLLLEETEKDLQKNIKSLRNLLLFRGEYDDLNVMMEFHPGAGGTEAMDWADMLLR
ncbi:MAG TPA: hypothetical protein DCZ41_04790, partial [Firmicutes bacterium]|nr:hypothetical protein [Bacillota bacterium]